MQAKLEGPSIIEGRLEVPKPGVKIYAYTKGDVEVRTSNVVIGQLSVANLNSYILFDFGAMHSFISAVHANRLNRGKKYYHEPLVHLYLMKMF